ncbi:CBN-LIN-59 protein [Caenorhabditis brenneri]|uniref:CBN-LIN-59 protein n=1 Tax=Caenorhabditis brenneri TaxID=135651 RepID=G0NJJ5_CAEBE|nr:CBN-LIN-59 protein [Caenorhabditis brenneri]
MHEAGEQQQRHKYANHNEEHNQQPTTSTQSTSRNSSKQAVQASLFCTPTATAALSVSGQPIKIGNSVLEPAGTLVFAKNESPTWSNGQRVIVHGNKHAVVHANLFPIGPPVLTVQAPTNGVNETFFMSQQSKVNTNSGSSSMVPLNTSSSNASATPDSGIQSVPTSPPSPGFDLMSRDTDNFDNDDPEDFTDMPRLRPVDEDDESFDVASTSYDPQTDINTISTPPPVHSTTTPSPTRDEFTNKIDPADCSSLSIDAGMNTEEIVQRLFRFGPDKAKTIAMLIKKKSAEETKSKKKKDMEAEVSSTTPTTPRTRCTRIRNRPSTRSTNSPDVTTSTSIEEPSTSSMGLAEESGDTDKVVGKKRGRKPKKKRVVPKEEITEDDVAIKRIKVELGAHSKTANTEETLDDSQQVASSIQPVDPVQFRLKVHEMMERQLENLTETMSNDMMEMRLSHSTTTKYANGKRKESFFRQLMEQSKKLRKNGVPDVKKRRLFGRESEPCTEIGAKVEENKKDVKEETTSSKFRSRLSSRLSRSDDPAENTLAPVEEKFNGEYYEIPKSIPHSDDIIPLWRAPSLACGCTKGACTSDMECLNRALRVQCSKECTVAYCSNQRFWKEDCGTKLYISNGPKTRRLLKTKLARRAGDFLCEYAGEVINNKMAQERFEETKDARIVAIGSQLFIDPIHRGNLARYIKHSCTPNCRLEVWSVGGFYRAGVFTLVDLSSNVEITIDKTGLVPFDVQCECGSWSCKKVIRGVRRGQIVNQDENEKIKTRRFLPRNRRKTILESRKSGLPSILLTKDNSSLLLSMKKMLAAFSFRIRGIDGSMPRSELIHYNSIRSYLKVKGEAANPAELMSLFRKWLDAVDDDDLERSFLAIQSHYLPSIVQSTQSSKKSNETATRTRVTNASCVSAVPSKPDDADLSYLESSFPIGSYDPDDAWEAYRANSDNAVRCVCGALDEDGDMVQCDECHFWLHIGCCDEDAEKDDFTCDFCHGTTDKSPKVDVKLREQPEYRFENCVYYRSLMNRRGIQVRLNETVYVNRKFNDDHKDLLEKLQKKGGKHREPIKYTFPEAPSEPLPKKISDRKDARIFRVDRLFVCPGNNRFVFGYFYAYAHETVVDSGRIFCKKEVFGTPLNFEALPLDEVIGKCLVVDEKTWCKGRPKVPMYKEDDVFFCEQQIGKNKRLEKTPAFHRYPINEKSYVFTKFSKPMKVVRDFKPYDSINSSPKPSKSQPLISAETSSTANSSSESIIDVDKKTLSKNHIAKVLERIEKKI